MRWRRRILPAQAGEVPLLPVLRFHQADLRLIQRHLRDIQGPRKNQRDHLDPNFERLGLHERSLAELRIVGDRNVVSRHATRQQRQRQVAHLHLPPQSVGEFRLQLRTEGVRVNEKGNCYGDHNEYRNNNGDNLQESLHDFLPPLGTAVATELKEVRAARKVYHCYSCISSGEGTETSFLALAAAAISFCASSFRPSRSSTCPRT